MSTMTEIERRRRENLERVLVAIALDPQSGHVDLGLLEMPSLESLPRYLALGSEGVVTYGYLGADPSGFPADIGEIVDLDSGDRYEVTVTVSLGAKIDGRYEAAELPDTIRTVEWDPAGMIEIIAVRDGGGYRCTRQWLPSSNADEIAVDRRQARNRVTRNYRINVAQAADMQGLALAQAAHGAPSA